jgi:hypothetical protein
MKKIFEIAVGAAVILGGVSAEAKIQQNLQKELFDLRVLKNGTIGNIANGVILTAGTDDIELGLKKGEHYVVDGVPGGVARLTNLSEEVKNPICENMQMVNTVSHMTMGIEDNSFIGMVPTGNKYNPEIGNIVNNLRNLGMYRNTTDDNSFFYTPNLTNECLDLFIKTRSKTIVGDSVILTTNRNFDLNVASDNEDDRTYIDGKTLKETKDVYNLKPSNIEGRVADSNSLVIKEMLAGSNLELKNDIGIPDSSIPVIYKKITFKGKYYKPTESGTSGSPITTKDGQFIGSHVASNKDNSTPILKRLKERCRDSKFDGAAICTIISNIDPNRTHLAYFSSVALSLKNQKLELKN